MNSYIEANAPHEIDGMVMTRDEKHSWLTEWGENIQCGCKELDARANADDSVRGMREHG